jgi:hypothetical protein
MDATGMVVQESAQAQEESVEQADKYLKERQRMYEEYLEQQAEQERQHREEESREAAEKVLKYERFIEQYETQLEEKAEEGNEIISEQMDLINQEAGEASGPVYDSLLESYEKHLQEGLAWPNGDFEECVDAVEKHKEDFRKAMEEEATGYIQKLKEEAQLEERKLEEEFYEKDDRIQSELDAIKADYKERLSKADPSEQDSIRLERNEALQKVQREAEMLSQEFDRRSEEMARKNKENIQKAQASAEYFGAIAAGGHPFQSQEANEKLEKSRKAYLKNDHQQAVLTAKRHEAGKRLEKAKVRERSAVQCEDKGFCEIECRRAVITSQVDAAPDAATREEILKSVDAELEKSVEDTKETKRNVEKAYAKEVYGLAKEKKVIETHAKADTEILDKRAEKYRKAQADIDASMASGRIAQPTTTRQKNLSREKDDLVKATEMTEREKQQLQQDKETKLRELDGRYKNSRQENRKEIARLDEEVESLEALRMEMKSYSNQDNPMDDVNQSIQSIDLRDDDDRQDATTSRRRQSESATQDEIEFLRKRPKQDTLFNKPAKKNINRLTGDDLRDLNNMKQEGKNLSSTEKPNKVKHGNTYIYEAETIDSLNDTDNAKWSNVANSKAAGVEETGRGARRQWTAKGNEDMTKIANHYPDQNLGIVRYNSKQESKKFGTLRSTQEEKDSNQRVAAKDPDSVNRSPLPSNMEVDEEEDHVATPLRQAKDNAVVDDYHLSKLVQSTKSEQLQDPARDPIKEPTGGDLYVYKLSGRQNEEEAVKEDELRWKRNRVVHSQNFKKEVFYARDENHVTKDFQKHVYRSHDGTRMAVHYVGDASLCVPKTGRFKRPEVKDN